MKLRNVCRSACLVVAATILPPLHADEGKTTIKFTIENLTHAITFRPFLVAAHPKKKPVFRTGEDATSKRFAGVQLMAECGGLGPAPFPNLVDRMTKVGADFVANPVNEAKPFDPPLGLLFPAGTTADDTAVPFDAGLSGSVSGTLKITRKRNTHLSVVAMLLPTNDAFAGLDSIRIPKRRGTHVFFLPAYDAGTEANDEILSDDNPLDCVPNEVGYPVDPLGNDGVGAKDFLDFEVIDRVHIHRGNLGDLDPAGGTSDLDSRVHRWLNPLVKLTIVVKPRKDNDDDDDDDD